MLQPATSPLISPPTSPPARPPSQSTAWGLFCQRLAAACAQPLIGLCLTACHGIVDAGLGARLARRRPARRRCHRRYCGFAQRDVDLRFGRLLGPKFTRHAGAVAGLGWGQQLGSRFGRCRRGGRTRPGCRRLGWCLGQGRRGRPQCGQADQAGQRAALRWRWRWRWRCGRGCHAGGLQQWRPHPLCATPPAAAVGQAAAAPSAHCEVCTTLRTTG